MKKGGWDIPDYELESIVKCFLPDIQEFFATDESNKLREQNKSGEEQKTPPQTNKTA